MSELHYKTMSEIAALLQSKSISSVELTNHYLNRIETLNPKLNAFRLICGERALETARDCDEKRSAGKALSPLTGIPFAVKDLFDVTGLPTSAGCHLLETECAEKNATAVSRLEQAGMVLLGKTNTVQFAYGGAGINHDHGTPHNPWVEEHHVPGGSSSGSGVAVAAGLSPVVLGTDTGGSVRIPAALCGITGFKTTVGQISRAGVYPLSWSLDSVGPLTRCVEDCARIFEHLQGGDPQDSTTAGRAKIPVMKTLDEGCLGLRVAFPQGVFWEAVDSQVERHVWDTKDILKDLGARIVDLDFDSAEQARTLNNRGLVIAAEAWSLNRVLLEQNFEQLDPIVSHRMIKGRDVPAHEYLKVCSEMPRLRARAAIELESVDAVVVPTTAIAARPVAQLDASIESYSQANLAYLRNTAIGNILNLCAVSVPCGLTSEGLPIGLMVYAKSFQEDIALRVANAYQHRTKWHHLTPDLKWIN